MQDQKSVTIIIVNWNQKKCLDTCLTSIKSKTNYKKFHTVVIDNGSTDGSPQMVREKFARDHLVVFDKNYGFSIGNNNGIIYALKKFNPDYLLLLNNDTEIIQSDWLNKLVLAVESTPNVGIVGCKLVYPNGKTQYIGTEMTVQGLSWINPETECKYPRAFDVTAVLGACFLIKREVIEKIGFLDIGFSPFVHEESDYCIRARKAGYRIRIILDAVVIHQWKTSIATVNSARLQYIVRRNFLRFMLLNFPLTWLVRRTKTEARNSNWMLYNEK